MTASISTDSALRADQQNKITARVLERGKNSAVKLAAVTATPGVGPVETGFGFPNELRSTACAKLGGLLTP
jgi:hypothetical protein